MKKVAVIILVVAMIVLFLVSGCNLQGEASRAVSDTTTQGVVNEPPVARTATPTEEHYVYGVMLEAKYSKDGLRYMHQDVLGSSRAITDTNGLLVETNTHRPYGEMLGASGERFTFTGKEAEGELMYYGARYYDSDTGRFTQKDPVGSGRNNFAYAANNPLKYVDPNGLEEQKPMAIMIYNTDSPEFMDEVLQYMSNYHDRFEFIVYGVNGFKEMQNVVSDVNALIDGGTYVARVNYFDHVDQSLMLGIKESSWKYLGGITRQEGRQTIIGTCYGGERCPVFDYMTRAAGSEGYVGTLSAFYGVTRYPTKNDLDGLLVFKKQMTEDISIPGLTIEEMQSRFAEEEEYYMDSSIDQNTFWEAFQSATFEQASFWGDYNYRSTTFTITPSATAQGLFNINLALDHYAPDQADSTAIQYNSVEYP
ncbi:MAG: RHS repeat-associated core domain-containing protein [archaeon]